MRKCIAQEEMYRESGSTKGARWLGAVEPTSAILRGAVAQLIPTRYNLNCVSREQPSVIREPAWGRHSIAQRHWRLGKPITMELRVLRF